MKRWIAAFAALLLLNACVPTGKQPDTDTIPKETKNSETVESLEGESNDASLDPPSTTGVFPEPVVAAPAPGTPGVFFADDFSALQTIVSQTEFLTYPERVTICITEAFVFAEALIICRDVDLIYLPTECAGGKGMTIRCDETVTALKVASASPMLLEGGLLSIDAPYAALEIVGDVLPDTAAVSLYCNVAEYNGEPLPGGYGGQSREQLTGVILYDSATGMPYEGVTLSIQGNLAWIQFPLIVKETDICTAKVEFLSTGGQQISVQDMNLTEAGTITISDGQGKSRTYMVLSERLSYGLPVMEIHTDGGEPIVEKNTYIHGTLTIDGQEYSMKIRGRGNASWNYFPKKAYRIKLDKGASLFGLAQNRDWVLVSNYADKTMIRNCVAHTMAASMSGLSYTPTHIPVNLYLNGVYMGVYTFADKIEEGNGRLDLGETVMAESGVADMGFLLEIGWDFDEENVYNRDYFDTNLVYRIFIKEPEIEAAYTPELLYIKNYIMGMESAIVSNNGWEAYIDVESWIDWFIINEMTCNTESSFYRSCYLWRDAGGKLKLGPVWDFDMAFGNHYGDLAGYDGWCTTESTYTFISTNWMNYLLQYESFTDRLIQRWDEVKTNLLTTALEAVDQYAAMLDGSQQQNFLVWKIMDVSVGMGSVNPYVYNTYEKQVQYLRDFIQNRWNYIENRLHSQEYGGNS